MNWLLNCSLRRLGQHRAGLIAVISFCLCVWWIFPFADLSENPAFNSDSAVVLSMATQPVPAAQSIFYWGTARSGSLLVPLGALLRPLLSERQLIGLFSIAAACFTALGCTVFAAFGRAERPGTFVAIPAGILLIGANFGAPPSFKSLSWLMTDVASRPELPCLLIAMTWLAVTLGRTPKVNWRSNWSTRFLLYVLAASTAAWVSDFALVAALLLAVMLTLIAAMRRERLPGELFVAFLLAASTLYLLRHLSTNGAAQTKTLLRLVNESSFRALIRPAIGNIAGHLSWSTWVAVGVISVTLALWSILNRKTAAEWFADRAYLHALLLLALGLGEFVTALSNQWVYDNGVFPRYFTPGVVLVCLGATQGALFLLRQITRRTFTVQKSILAGFAGVALIFPVLLSTHTILATRNSLAQGSHSIQYENSDALYRAGARTVIGPYWKAYVSVLAHPVKMKATPRDGDEDRSPANTINCLRARYVAFVDETPGALGSHIGVRGFELEQANVFPPQKLVDETYFKFYRNTGRLTIDARDPATLLYLGKGWHFGERNGTEAWVWASGREAEMHIPLHPLTRYRVEIEAFSFPAQSGRAQAAVLSVGGAAVAALEFDRDGVLLTRRVEFNTGPTAESHFVVASELALPESVVNRSTANERILAVAVRRISFEPLHAAP